MENDPYQILPKLIAHRCNDAHAIQKALDLFGRHLPVYMECDVRATADHVLVMHHDETWNGQPLDRTAYVELQGDVLSLETVIQMIKPSGIPLHLDVKARQVESKWRAVVDGDRLYNLLARTGMLSRVIVTTVAGKFLRRLRELSAEVRLGVLYDEDYGDLMPPSKGAVNRFIDKIMEFHEEIGLEAIFLNQEWLRVFDQKFKVLDTFFYTIAKAGIKIAVWTVDDETWAQRFVDQGAEWITTDRTDWFRKIIEQDRA